MDEKSIYASQMKYRKAHLVQLNLDLSREMKLNFKKACENNKTKPATVLKSYIQKYIEENL